MKNSILMTITLIVSILITIVYTNIFTICITSCVVGLWLFDLGILLEELKNNDGNK